MTPEGMAALHAAAFTVPRPWTAGEFAGLLAQPIAAYTKALTKRLTTMTPLRPRRSTMGPAAVVATSCAPELIASNRPTAVSETSSRCRI